MIKNRSKTKFINILGIIILSLLIPIIAYSQKLPKPVGYVNDFASVMDESSKQKIERLAEIIKKTTGAEIAVVTVKSIEPYADIEEFSINLATKWGIGEKGKDNGILIVLAMKERRVRIEVGYGLEGIIPDGLAGEIMDKSMLPYFRNGNYSIGLLKGVEAVAGIIAAIGVSSQAPTMLPLDIKGNPLRNALIWMDRRSEKECDFLRQKIGEAKIKEITGNRIDPYFAFPKFPIPCTDNESTFATEECCDKNINKSTLFVFNLYILPL